MIALPEAVVPSGGMVHHAWDSQVAFEQQLYTPEGRALIESYLRSRP